MARCYEGFLLYTITHTQTLLCLNVTVIFTTNPFWYSQAPKETPCFLRCLIPLSFNANNGLSNGNLLQYINLVVDAGDQLVMHHDRLRSTQSLYCFSDKVICLCKLENNIASFSILLLLQASYNLLT